ncbi:MAG TPA: 2Fe-2S iron-sulfur cluster-binding protein [Pyrinomonadaceae bacterium]|nr:2Fe-2S iron-sulfur cluster-binding protein [Pyrinomonadaceae bacterium]
MNNQTAFEEFLDQQNEEAWSAALATLRRSIHEVDRNATQIWFAFYPLSLFLALDESEDRERLAQQLLLQGDYELTTQINTSHRFLYGHRFWPQVKQAIEAHAESGAANLSSLADQILSVARRAAAQTKRDESLLVGITAAGFMTLRQTRLAAFKAAAGAVSIDQKQLRKSPEQVLRDRARDDGRGLFGFLKTVNHEWPVTWDENDGGARYKLREGQDLAWGAAGDQSRDWRAIDPRRTEGPIPVECRAASCGTCWVGVLGGAEKLSDVGAREGKKIKEFGYVDTAEPKPLIRLACQAQANGAVSIVIPPWNGQYGKYLKSLRPAEETATLPSDSAPPETADDAAVN